MLYTSMKIQPICLNNINQNKTVQTKKQKNSTLTFVENRAFSIPYFGSNLHYAYSRDNLINYLEQNPKPKAEGTDGIIYKFGDVAVKVAKSKDTSFEAEAEILKKLPQSLNTAQNFVDRFEYKGKDVLVSSFVEGAHKQNLTSNDIEKIFGVILAHDKENIIHGDLNLGNIIFSRTGEVSFIDYGVATQPLDTEVELYPSFVANTNALKFENTGINDTLKKWEEEGISTEKFSQYLRKKADFYSKHKELAKRAETKSYEENLSIVLQNPSQSIVEAELKRIKALDLLEQADTATNYDNNPYLSIELWNKTVEKASEYEQYTAQKINEAETQEEQTYFTYQNQIAKCFHSTLSDWRNGTLSWLYEIKNPTFIPRSETESRLQKNWNKK